VWQLDAPAVSPPRRTGYGFAFDVTRGRAILFGGLEAAADGGVVPLGDTWEWNGTSWTSACSSAPCNGQAPGPRDGFAFAFDSARGKTVLSGGCASAPCTAPFGDTWEWDGKAWSQACTSAPCNGSAPAARIDAAMSFDGGRGKIVFFGGNSVAGSRADTWEWDGAAWALACDGSSGCPSPAPRAGHVMAYDVARKQTLLYGGRDSHGTILGDLWAWDGARWAQLCGGAPCTATQPLGRVFSTMVYDTARQSTLLYAGCSGVVQGVGCAATPVDAWEWNGAAWHDIPTAPYANPGPVPDQSIQMAYDSQSRRMLVADGDGLSGTSLESSLLEYYVVGDACASGSTCDTSICQDGVCCEATCADPCDSCDTPASAGVCASRPACVTACDGDHTLTTSDGKGSIDCSPYECQPGGKCKTTCTTAADCVSPNVCDPSSHTCVTSTGGPKGGAGGGSSGCVAGGGEESRVPEGLAVLAFGLAFVVARRRRNR